VKITKIHETFVWVTNDISLDPPEKYFNSSIKNIEMPCYIGTALTKQDIEYLIDEGAVDWGLVALYWKSRVLAGQPIFVHNFRTVKSEKIVQQMLEEEPDLDIEYWEENWNDHVESWTGWAEKFVPNFYNLDIEITHNAENHVFRIVDSKYLLDEDGFVLSNNENGHAPTIDEFSKRKYRCIATPIYVTKTSNVQTTSGAKVPVNGVNNGRNPSVKERRAWISHYNPSLSTGRMTDEALLSTMEEVVNDLIVNEPPEITGTYIATPYNGATNAINKDGTILGPVAELGIRQSNDVITSSAIVARCDGGVYDSDRSPLIDNSQVNDDYILWEVAPVLDSPEDMDMLDPDLDKLGEAFDILREYEHDQTT